MIQFLKNIFNNIFKASNRETIISVRVATTVTNDSIKEIENKTKSLLTEILYSNNIKNEDILFVIFSSTSDLTSHYPATVARTQLGLRETALFSTIEPNIDGALDKCIRILLVFKTQSNLKIPKYIYQEGAKNLRND